MNEFMIKIGIIGGSGLDDPKIVENPVEKDGNTKYGKTSSKLTIGRINGVQVVIIARHGKDHTIPPTQVNYKANIQALKDEGCTHIIATTAVGSLRKDIGRGDLVILDQFIDFTRRRDLTFFDKFEPKNAKHTAMAEPFNMELRDHLIKSCEDLKFRYHLKGTVITIEGPRFSTKAESKMFRTWGADVINMSVAPECILANEIGIPYSAIAMSTDYDSLFDDVPPVTWEEILKVFHDNADKVIHVLLKTIPKIR